MQDNSSATTAGFSFRQGGGGGPGPPAETRHSNTSAAAHNTTQHFTPASHTTHSSQVHMEHNDCGHGPSGMVACMVGGGWRSAETHLGDIDLSGGRVAGGQWSPG